MQVKSKEFIIKGNKKSVAGSLAMFCVTLIIFLAFLTYSNSEYVVIKSILIAILMTIIEAYSIKGTDNITVPLVTSLLALLMV